MLITLMKKNETNTTVLPERVSGRYQVMHTDADGEREALLVAEADGDCWVIKSGSGSEIITPEGVKREIIASENMLCTVHILKTDENAALYMQKLKTENMVFRKVIPANSCSFTIGSAEMCDIYIRNYPVGECCARIDYENGSGFSLTACTEGSGIYKNGTAAENGRLKSGDVLSFFNIRFVFGKNFIAYNYNDSVEINNSMLFRAFVQAQRTEDITYYFDDEYNHGLFFCSPRFKKEIQPAEISVEYPPQSGLSNQTPMALTIGPSVTMGLSSAATASFTVINQINNGGNIMTVMPSVIMASSMLLSSLLWPVITKTYDKSRKKREESKRKIKYIGYLKSQYAFVEKIAAEQTAILKENNPSLEVLAQRIETRDRALWERMYGQSDFLSITVGTGEVPLNLKIRQSADKFTLDEDVLRSEAEKFLAQKRVIADAPVEISLIESPVVGIIGARKNVLGYIKSWLLQLAALYSYDALGIIVIYDECEDKDWEYLRWLPHIWNAEGDVRMIASDANELKVVSAEAEKIRLGESGENKRYVIISASRKLALKADFLGRVIKNAAETPFSVITLYDAMSYIPKECLEVIEVTDESRARLYRMDSHGDTEEFDIPDSSAINMGKLCVALSNIRLAQNSEAFTLPPSYTFLEMFGVSKVEHLNCLRRWADSNPVESLAAPIGIDSHGDLCMLDLHQKYHGPHGLIAGMTGSGKSEFIMTVILSLAVNYHPDEVAFILIDYKGGGMAHAFEHLPHVAGIITNLDGSAITRSLVSIQSELKRRQRLFGEAEQQLGTSNLDIYKYQKLYRDGKVSEPLPHLIIIADEFAELKTQLPEFMEQLISAARIGRSLGVHLVLATQKPNGVVSDQIWSNSKFKICLKVQDNADSVGMIKRPDAAALVDVGRFYLQVGYNEYFELGQSAWCGANYEPESSAAKKSVANITVIDRIGRTIVQTDDTVKTGKKKSVLEKKQLDAVTGYIAELAREENVCARALWLEPIPEVVILDELIRKYGYIQPKDRFCAVVGECDVPENQEQKLLCYDLEQAGNIVVFGASGSGKTTFLTAVTYSLCSCYSPSDVWIYILDFNAQTMKNFGRLNHVGDVMLPDDKEKISHFFTWITKELSRRRKILSETDGGYYSYIHSGGFMPWICVMIHNFGAFGESYPEYEELIGVLAREGIKYGIGFILTAITVNAVRFRIVQNFKTQVSLQLTDESYGMIFGPTRGLKPAPIKGRGLVMNDGLNEFQTAYIAEPDAVSAAVSALSERLASQYPSTKAFNIPVLPEVYRPSLAEKYAGANGNVIPAAFDITTVEPYMYNTQRAVIYVISKTERKPIFIQGLAELLSKNADVIVCDEANKFIPLAETGYRRFTDRKQFVSAVSEISADTQTRTYIFINGMGSFMNSVIMPERKIIETLMAAAVKNAMITFVISDKMTETGSYSSEAWFKEVQNGSYIWLGSGLFDQYQFQLSNRGKNVELGEDYGYIVEDGRAECVKLLSSEVYEIEK